MQIFVSLTLLVMCTEIDFSPMGLFLYPALIGLITYAYLIIIHRSNHCIYYIGLIAYVYLTDIYMYRAASLHLYN